MTEKRTERIYFRVHPSTKAEWEATYEQLGYANMTDFIVAAVDQFSALGSTGSPVGDDVGSPALAERAGDSVDEPESEVTPGEVHATVAEPDSAPAHPDGGEPVAPALPRRAVFTQEGCPLRMYHRPGWKCKGCGAMFQ